MSRKTLVLGASAKAGRFSMFAIKKLVKHNIEVVAIGSRTAEIEGITIHCHPIILDDIHTVTLYLNPKRQEQYLDYIIGLKPKRIIFNPGTENPSLLKLARKNGIETVYGCTLVMLNDGSY